MNTATGIMLVRLVEQMGWQMAIETMRHRNHPSRIYEWPANLQLFEYTSAIKYGSLAQLVEPSAQVWVRAPGGPFTLQVTYGRL